MAAKREIEYQEIDFKRPARIQQGVVKGDSVTATENIRLLRVIDEFSDTLFVIPRTANTGVIEGTEVPWSNVASALRLLKKKSDAQGDE